MVSEGTRAGTREANILRERAGRATGPAIVIAVLVAVAVSTAIRLWFIFHQPLNSDELIDGLMARQILHGHFSAFYWGQVYGGVGPYLTAGLFAIFGQGTLALRLSPELLSVVAALLTWRIALRLVRDRGLAALAGALLWCFSEISVWNSTYDWVFRGVAMSCGLGALLSALRLLDGHKSLSDAIVFGALVGFGWWSSPEMAYFLFPAAILLVVAYRRSARGGRLRSWAGPIIAATLTALICALPWEWVNVMTRFASLRTGTLHVPGDTVTGNLSAFFDHALPLELGLQRMYSGAWLFGNGDNLLERVALVFLLSLVGLAIACSIVICLFRDAKSRVIAVAIVAFPVLYAASPATGYWGDGRYVVYIGPFLVLAFVTASETLPGLRTGLRRRQWRHVLPRNPRSALGVTLTLAIGLVLVGFHQVEAQTPSSFFRAWVNPDAPARQTAKALLSKGIDAGYANYWIAYKLDFMGYGSLQIATDGDDVDRSHRIDEVVARARHPAWLFASASETTSVSNQFGSADGPGGQSESSFRSWLAQQHIQYRVIDAGMLVAVLPDKPVPVVHTGLRNYA
jgi:hypothetical protein